MSKPIILSNGVKTFKFNSQSACEKRTMEILNELGITDSVKLISEEHFIYLKLLCERHPRHLDKLNNFVDFQIKQSGTGLELNIVYDDDTSTGKSISWRKCVTGKGSSPKASCNDALRECISSQIKKFRDASDLSYCRECNCSIDDINPPHIDHHEPQFAQLVEEFIELKSIIIPTKYDKQAFKNKTIFKADDYIRIGKPFERYHLDHAILRVLCEKCNTTREKYKKPADL